MVCSGLTSDGILAATCPALVVRLDCKRIGSSIAELTERRSLAEPTDRLGGLIVSREGGRGRTP
jgi:hypothetical protein